MSKLITNKICPELVAFIRNAQSIALCAHVNPDGDTVGSVLGLRLGLLQLGKRVRVFCQDKLPDLLEDLPGFDCAEDTLEEGTRFDLVLPLDISNDYRMGTLKGLLERGDHTALVDHHGTNPGYCEVNVIDGDAPANCLLIYGLLRQLGVTVTADIACCLYAGISTDTGNFAFGSTNAEAFRVTSELMATGFPMAELNRKLFRARDKAQLLLIRQALNTLRFAHDDRIACMTLTRQDFIDCGALEEHADTVVNFGMDLKRSRMAVLLRETADGRIKLSLRSIAPWRVDGLANELGGGGHNQAAGATMEGSLQECADRVIAMMDRYLTENEEALR